MRAPQMHVMPQEMIGTADAVDTPSRGRQSQDDTAREVKSESPNSPSSTSVMPTQFQETARCTHSAVDQADPHIHAAPTDSDTHATAGRSGQAVASEKRSCRASLATETARRNRSRPVSPDFRTDMSLGRRRKIAQALVDVLSRPASHSDLITRPNGYFNMQAVLYTGRFRREHIIRREVHQVVQESTEPRFETALMEGQEVIRIVPMRANHMSASVPSSSEPAPCTQSAVSQPDQHIQSSTPPPARREEPNAEATGSPGDSSGQTSSEELVPHRPLPPPPPMPRRLRAAKRAQAASSSSTLNEPAEETEETSSSPELCEESTTSEEGTTSTTEQRQRPAIHRMNILRERLMQALTAKRAKMLGPLRHVLAQNRRLEAKQADPTYLALSGQVGEPSVLGPRDETTRR